MFIAGLLAIGIVGFSQAVKDRQVIPVAVNLNQVLRMTITNGGNIEFVFISIDDYRSGLSGDATASAASKNPGPVGKTGHTVRATTHHFKRQFLCRRCNVLTRHRSGSHCSR